MELASMATNHGRQNSIHQTLHPPFLRFLALKDYHDKCRESLNKDYYEVIKKAYAKGKIVLKDYKL
jgi:hypothetical protein